MEQKFILAANAKYMLGTFSPGFINLDFPSVLRNLCLKYAQKHPL